MLTKVRLVLLALLLVGSYAVTPQAVNATGAIVSFDFVVTGYGSVSMTPSADAPCNAAGASTCSFTAAVGEWVTFSATSADGQTLIAWGGHAEGWCELSPTCRYRVPASGPTVSAEFAPARSVTVLDDGRIALEFVDTHAALVGADQGPTCFSEQDLQQSCTFFASRTGQISLQVPYGESAYYPYTRVDGVETDDAEPTNGLWSHGPGEDNLMVSVSSFRRTLTLNPPAGVTMALITQDEGDWVGQLVKDSTCVGPARCVNYIYEREYIVGISVTSDATNTYFDHTGCDGGTVESILEFAVGCIIPRGVSNEEVGGVISAQRLATCSTNFSGGGYRGYVFSESGGFCADENSSTVTISSARDTRFYIWPDSDNQGSPMFLGWRGDCGQKIWNEICAVPAGSGDISVVADFGAARVLKNRTFVFRDSYSGLALSGGTFAWYGNSNTSSIARAKIPANGQYKFGSIMGGTVYFQLFDVTVGSKWQLSGYARAAIHAGPLPPQLSLGSDVPGVAQIPISVKMESGRPVPGALVSYSQSDPCTKSSDQDGSMEWTLLPTVCVASARTNERGETTLVVPDGPWLTENLEAVVTYGDMNVWNAEFVEGWDGVRYAIIPDLPFIDMESVTAEYKYGSPVLVNAVVRNSDGNPLQGATVVLSGISKADSTCTFTQSKITNSAGRVTFTVCPKKSTVMTLSSTAGVQAKVKVNVRMKPSAVRSVVPTAGLRSVALKWIIPSEVNAGPITDYIIQYRLRGTTTWITSRDGVSTARKTTVNGLTKGRVYEFRIAAKNKAGIGNWSQLLSAKPK